MSSYKWCHGPNCHERETTTRVRGNKGSKVLRTVKIKQTGWNKDHYYEYFCDQTCLMEYIKKHLRNIVAIAPRLEALETPVDVVVETHTDYYGNPYKTKVIKQITS